MRHRIEKVTGRLLVFISEIEKIAMMLSGYFLDSGSISWKIAITVLAEHGSGLPEVPGT